MRPILTTDKGIVLDEAQVTWPEWQGGQARGADAKAILGAMTPGDSNPDR